MTSRTNIMVFFLILLIIFIILPVLAMRGRRSHPGMDALRGWSYAHRGLHDEALPENSMGAFRAALEQGYGIELDVHLLKDGSLAVIHDSDLKRVTGQEGCVEDLTAAELENYHLCGTEETIPLFSQVLELYQGKAPLIVEVKVHDDNFAAVTEATCKLLEQYDGAYCLESFDPRSVLWLKQHRPELIRGQLTENYFLSRPSYPRPLWFIMRHQLANFLTRPDFVAYRFQDRNSTISNQLVRKLWGVQGVAWTLRTRDEYDTAVAEGWLPIFENFIP